LIYVIILQINIIKTSNLDFYVDMYLTKICTWHYK